MAWLCPSTNRGLILFSLHSRGAEYNTSSHQGFGERDAMMSVIGGMAGESLVYCSAIDPEPASSELKYVQVSRSLVTLLPGFPAPCASPDRRSPCNQASRTLGVRPAYGSICALVLSIVESGMRVNRRRKCFRPSSLRPSNPHTAALRRSAGGASGQSTNALVKASSAAP
jgi:hypothetical protein